MLEVEIQQGLAENSVQCSRPELICLLVVLLKETVFKKKKKKDEKMNGFTFVSNHFVSRSKLVVLFKFFPSGLTWKVNISPLRCSLLTSSP